MSGNSLAAMELVVFLGFIAWLLYYQYSSSRRGQSSASQPPATDTAESRVSAPEADREEQRSS